MTPLVRDYKSRKAPGALFAILLTLGVNVALFGLLAYVNREEPPVVIKELHKSYAATPTRLKQVTIKPLPPKPRPKVKKAVRPCPTLPAPLPRTVAIQPALQPLATIESPLPTLTLTASPVTLKPSITAGGFAEATPDNEYIASEDEVDQPPKATYKPQPNYPFSARRMGYTGKVIIALIIDEDGMPQAPEIHTSTGHRSLDNSAIETIRRWRFEPAKNNGEKVPVRGTISFNFQLR